MTFTYNGRDFDLFDHPYNATITNERAVEIPIARAFVAEQEGVGLELGNVLGHYGCTAPRRIVDRYEEADSGEHLDVFAIDGAYDWIVSVSTIEHIRNGEPSAADNLWGAVAALAYLRGLLAPGGRMLVTVGVGQNPTLDAFLLADLSSHGSLGRGPFHASVSPELLVRDRGEDPAENHWREYDHSDHNKFAYGPTHGANAVWIGEWGPT